MKKNVSFHEIQSLKQWWIWLILAFANFTLLYGCYKQLILDQHYGNNPIGNTELIIVTLVVLLITIGVAMLKLETMIDKTGVYVRFLPFQKNYKFFDWKRVESYKVRKYSPIIEFGGWGYRIAGRRKRAYNMYGKMGLYLVLFDGSKVLVGTQKPEEMDAYLTELSKYKVD